MEWASVLKLTSNPTCIDQNEYDQGALAPFDYINIEVFSPTSVAYDSDDEMAVQIKGRRPPAGLEVEVSVVGAPLLSAADPPSVARKF